MARLSLIFPLILAASLLAQAGDASIYHASSEAVADLIVGKGESIQAAIDECPEDGTISIEPGFYREQLVIAKSLTLRSARPPQTEASPVCEPDEFRTELGNDAISIAGGVIIQSGLVTLQGVHIHAEEDATSVDVRGGRVSLESCVLELGNEALMVHCGAVVTMESCEIGWVLGTGVVVEPGASLSASRCYIRMTGGHGADVRGALSMQECRIEHCGELLVREDPISSGGHGVFLGATGSAHLTNSWIEECRGFGIFADVGADGNVPGTLAGSGNVIVPAGDSSVNFRRVIFEAELPESFYAERWHEQFNFQWEFAGQRFEAPLQLPIPDYVFQAENQVSFWMGYSDPAEATRRAGLYSGNTETLSPLVDSLLSMAECSGLTREETVAFFAAFIAGSISYDHDRLETSKQSLLGGGTETLYPAQTLFLGRGVCRDTALLLCLMLDVAGYDAVYVSLSPGPAEDTPHAAVGVALATGAGSSILHEGNTFYVLESKGGSPGGFPLSDWGEPAVVALTPTPFLRIQVGECSLIGNPFTEETARVSVPVVVRNVGTAIAHDVCCRYEVNRFLLEELIEGTGFVGVLESQTVCLGSVEPGSTASFLANSPEGGTGMKITAWAHAGDREAAHMERYFSLSCE